VKDSVLIIPITTFADTGVYEVEAYNGCATIFRDQIHVDMNSRITLISAPNDTAVCMGTPLRWELVTADGDAEWYDENGNGLGTNVIEWTNTQISDSREYVYRLKGAAACSHVAEFDTVKLFVGSVTSLEVVTALGGGNVSVCEGDTLKLTFSTNDFHHNTWYYNDIVIAGEKDSVIYVTSNAGGKYKAIASNGCDNISDSVNVFTQTEAVITTKPGNLAVCKGDDIDLVIEAIDATTVTWKFKGTTLKTVNVGEVFTIENVDINNAGRYYIEVAGVGHCVNNFVRDSIDIRVDVEITNPSYFEDEKVTLCTGEALELKFTIDNFYENIWSFNTVENEIPGQKDSIFRIDSVTSQDSGMIIVTSINGCKDFVRDTMLVDVLADPIAIFTVEPADTAICAQPGEVEFVFAVKNANMSSYTWFNPDGTVRNTGVDTIMVSTLEIENSGYYVYQVVSSGVCNKPVRDSVELFLSTTPPTITEYLGNDTIICADDVYFLSIQADDAFRYKWYRDNQLIMTTKNSVLQVTEPGKYKVVAYNGCGEVSDSMKLTVYERAGIVVAPADTVGCDGQPMVLAAEVAGDSLSYEWFFNDGLLTGSNADTLEIIVNSSAEGLYHIVASNFCSADTSEAIMLKVNYPLVQMMTLKDTLVCEGVEFTLEYAAVNAMAYEWTHADTVVSEDSVLSIGHLLVADSGRYYVRTYNHCSELIDSVFIRVSPLPKVDALIPSGVVVIYERSSIMLTAKADHVDAHQWLFDGNPITDDNSITGAETDTLKMKNVNNLKHSGEYKYVARNTCGSSTSEIVKVIVLDTTMPNVLPTKIASKSVVYLDSIMTFPLKVLNNDSTHTVTDVRLIDTVPEGFEVVLESNIFGKLVGENILDFIIADTLYPNAQEQFTYKVKAKIPGIYTNTVHVQVPEGVTVHNKSASVDVEIQSEKDIEITKICNTKEALVADIVTYTITVVNKGKGAFMNVVVYDTLPREGVLKNVTLTSYAIREERNVENQTYLYEFDRIDEGDSVIIYVDVMLMVEGYLTSTAGVEVPDYEYNTLNNYAISKVFVHGQTINVTTITPNGDGYNDNFEIPMALTYPVNEIYIYNRTGNLVFTKRNYYNEFDAAGLPDGVYFYLFTYTNATGEKRRVNGHINVIRTVN
jgi:gliding motility-associated-like protein/uncharacterized repeat protein (TIGR01451 family)